MSRAIAAALALVVLCSLAFAAGQWVGRGSAVTPGQGVEAALAEPDAIARAQRLAPLLRDPSPEEFAAVVDAYEAGFPLQPPPESAIRLLCEAWASVDPVGAFDRISGWPAEQRFLGLEALLQAWARSHPLAALEWAGGVRDQGEAIQAVYAGWAESGSESMWEHVMSLPQGMERESASIAMMQWVVARDGFDALLRRVETLPDDAPGRFKLAAFRTATGLVADHDPERALAFVERHAGGPYDKGLLRRVAIRSVLRDAPGTLEGLIERPPGEERDWALREAYRRWLRRDRSAALTWMPASGARDPRFAALVDVHAVALANDDPEQRGRSISTALAWAGSVAEPERRREALVKVGVIWLHHRPAEAGSWLQQRGLLGEVRAELGKRRRIRGLAETGGTQPPGDARNDQTRLSD